MPSKLNTENIWIPDIYPLFSNGVGRRHFRFDYLKTRTFINQTTSTIWILDTSGILNPAAFQIKTTIQSILYIFVFFSCESSVQLLQFSSVFILLYIWRCSFQFPKLWLRVGQHWGAVCQPVLAIWTGSHSQLWKLWPNPETRAHQDRDFCGREDPWLSSEEIKK